MVGEGRTDRLTPGQESCVVRDTGGESKRRGPRLWWPRRGVSLELESALSPGGPSGDNRDGRRPSWVSER